ncbi:sarcosine oxidase subunit delta [Aliigemmobacter aestuarii]|uniref:Sarcosine oxidase subunit delta n=1 Tax=Aliigemmobacter aestuarii TaxID=1445661 RepID=A0A4S3MS33_9RHOB|nr:sarcosine oxidase subunit delta [Gemmobacter aestuarii]THD84645.1 sarcosine oxidase subunit delta [Gemmobacter aestuarii]
MRIPCPLCGTRDRREFYYYGSDDYLNRPAADAPAAAWDDMLHNRDNPAGVTRDLWYHETGCAQWLAVTRNTVTHEILGSELVADLKTGPKSARKGGEK